MTAYGLVMHDVVVLGSVERNEWKQEGLATVAAGATLERAEGLTQVPSKGLTPV